MKTLLRLAAAALALSFMTACRRGAPVPEGFAEYRDQAGRFSCALPADWRGAARVARVAAIGPALGPAAFDVTLSVALYPQSDPAVKTPEDYRHARLSSAAGELTPRAWNGRAAFELSSSAAAARPQEPPRSEKALLIPDGRGLAVLRVTYGAAGAAEADRAFSVLAQSLRLP
jgi:hypothetical protein